ncbi:MAG: TorF family putative porin [Gammaproteobacteria bacterium]|nr:TorF family putative porin [Gammaproteobacteria bacterium]
MKISLFALGILFFQHAQADVSADLNFTDNYIYRGISNSNNGPAIQGGIDYYNELGLYTGIWATTMDFQLPDGDPSYEFDMYGGVTGEFAGINWGVGLLRFTYPNTASKWKLDAHEFHLGLNKAINDITIGTVYHYSPDYSGAGHSHYIETNIDLPLPYEFNLALHAGHQTFANNVWYGLPDYTDWRIAVGRDIAGFQVDLGWTDTDVNNNDACFFGSDWCDSTFSIDVRTDFQLF